MSGDQLVETEQLLREENPDLWKWLTEQQAPPAHVQSNSIFQVCCCTHYYLHSMGAMVAIGSGVSW